MYKAIIETALRKPYDLLFRELRTSEKQFSNAFHFAPIGIALVQPNGRWLKVNRAVCAMLGYTEEELLSKTFQDITHPDDLKADLDQVRQMLDGPIASYQSEKRYVHKNGSTIWVLRSTSLVRDDDGNPQHFIAQIIDITERKLMEDRLSRTSEQLQFVLDGSQQGFWDWNIETGEVARNERWAEMLGYTLKEVEFKVKQWTDLIHPDDRERAWTSIKNHIEGLTPFYEQEYRMLTKDGEYKWILDRARIVQRDAHGKPARMSGTHTDITRLKLSEEELQAKNTEMERFAYTVSHDLKSPLITIQIYAGMILKNMEAGKYERAIGDMKRIEDAASKMNALLGDLLELSRAGRQMSEPAQVDMNRLVKDTLTQLAGSLKQNQVEVSVQPDLPAVHGDHKRISEIVQNLIENAIKYRGDQSAPRIEIGVRLEAKESVFFVSDNGIGIDPRQHERIFGLFNKLDTKSEGTGVGLALVKRFIEVHRGRVWVESDGVGMGSTFCFTVPKKL
jgi:PAS domain S-box-containing protein